MDLTDQRKEHSVETAPGQTGPAAADPVADPVADAVHRLESVAGLPLEQRPDAFQTIHEDLRSALAEIDDA